VILGRVVGEVWATRKDARLGRCKLLIIRPQGIYEPRWATGHLVAVDDVHAGVGDQVVVCLGEPARRSLGAGGGPGPGAGAGRGGAGQDFPVDAAVLGIVDRVAIDDGAARSSTGAGPGVHRALALWQGEVAPR
jgi:ethanolamine utilization protein EutN